MKSYKLLIITVSLLCHNFNEVFGKKGFGPGNQEWGHLEVYPDDYIFSWFYHADPLGDPTGVNSAQKPLIIWIGFFSSAVFNFGNFGPFDLDSQYRNSSLANDYNNLFIDNILGAGFSYTNNDDALYNLNTEEIIDMTISVIIEFLETHPQFNGVPTYLIAENLNGRTASGIAYRFNSAQWSNEHKTFNLTGIVLANPSISLIDSVKLWIKSFKSTNLFNDEDKRILDLTYQMAKSHVQNRKYRSAYNTACDLLDITADALGTPENYKAFDTLNTEDFSGIIDNNKLLHLMNGEVKDALGISVGWGLNNSSEIFENLKNEIMMPMLSEFARLLESNKFKVAIINTNLNFEVSDFNTLNWVKKLKWPGASEWSNKNRVPFKVGDNFIGMYKNLENFYQFQFMKKETHGIVLDPSQAMRKILRTISG